MGGFGQIWVFGQEYVKLKFQLIGHIILGPWGPKKWDIGDKRALWYSDWDDTMLQEIRNPG